MTEILRGFGWGLAGGALWLAPSLWTALTPPARDTVVVGVTLVITAILYVVAAAAGDRRILQ